MNSWSRLHLPDQQVFAVVQDSPTPGTPSSSCCRATDRIPEATHLDYPLHIPMRHTILGRYRLLRNLHYHSLTNTAVVSVLCVVGIVRVLFDDFQRHKLIYTANGVLGTRWFLNCDSRTVWWWWNVWRKATVFVFSGKIVWNYSVCFTLQFFFKKSGRK